MSSHDMTTLSSKPGKRSWALLPALPLLAFVVLVPVAVQDAHHAPHDAARMAQLAVLLVAAAQWCAYQWSARSWLVPSRPWTLALLGVLAIASVAASDVPAMAGRELALIVGIAAVIHLGMKGICAAGHASARVAVLGACGLYAFVVLMLATATVLSGRPLIWQELIIGYDNYRFFNHAQAVALPLLAGAVTFQRRRGLLWWWGWMSLVVYVVVILGTGARGTAAAVLGAALLGLLALGRATAWPIIRTILLAALLGGALYATLALLPALTGDRMPAPEARSVASLASDSARLQLWGIAWDQLCASTWLGIGPMHYAHIPNPKAAHPHNVYLQVAAEWGLPMLVLLLGLAWRGLERMRQAVRSVSMQSDGTQGATLWIACVAVLIDGFVSGNFVMPVSQMWIALCAAWSWAWMRMHHGGSAGTAATLTGRWGRRLAGVAVLMSQIWLVASVLPEALDLRAHLEHVRRDLVHNEKTNPRFWSHGWF
ncbi:MAG TPA: O-antigen ligase family protein [Ideonella sp.]|uniref:O-antigen ligase family protein n=1 Tax=Ideonella sp. TaxID=1929293 RepID=UPI002E368EDB|nr:O-antigen ligase family protein [Ideonella sp.]HEX5687652.1 O-antigen ligase family protein [Ideonella sp.]